MISHLEPYARDRALHDPLPRLVLLLEFSIGLFDGRGVNSEGIETVAK